MVKKSTKETEEAKAIRFAKRFYAELLLKDFGAK
jgi:hypothetical protein